MNESDDIKIDDSLILIVDDDAVIRELLRRVLERSGFRVDEASSGEEAVRKVEKEIPDLVLLDVVMDGIDGFSACRKIKAIQGMDEVPIIFVTARSDTDSVVEGLDAGGRDYVTKPINRHEAIARIRNHLKLRVLMGLQRQFIDGLREANLAKNRIIGVASHDLRNPLASIRGLSEFLLETGSLDEDQLEMVQTIQTTSDSMLQLVDELLDISVIESGQDRLEKRPCSISALIQSSLNVYHFFAREKSIELSFKDNGLADQLMLDKVQFRRLVDNLISNAVKYSPSNSHVLVTTEKIEEILRIIVEDEGPGIPEEEVHKLFKDFGKTSVRPTGGESSTGLGLSICRQIAAAHHGKVYFENRKDRAGSRFIVELDTEALRVPETFIEARA